MKEINEDAVFSTDDEKKKEESPNFTVRLKNAAEKKAMQDKFKKFCDDNGMANNKQLLEDMVGVYETYLFREGVPAWQPQVDDLELHLQALRVIGRNLIQSSCDAKDLAMKEVKIELDTAAETIKMQKDKIALIEKSAADAIRAGEQAQKDAAAAIAANLAELEKLRTEHKADEATIKMYEAKESEAAAQAEKNIADVKAEAAAAIAAAEKAAADAKVEAEKRCVALEKDISKRDGIIEALKEAAAKAEAKAEKKDEKKKKS